MFRMPSAISYALRGQIDPHDRALYGYVNGALGYLRHLYDADPNLLDSRISHDAVTSLERLEVELNKRVAQQQPKAREPGHRSLRPKNIAMRLRNTSRS